MCAVGGNLALTANAARRGENYEAGGIDTLRRACRRSLQLGSCGGRHSDAHVSAPAKFARRNAPLGRHQIL
jgi:hypothetical protein